MSLLSHTAAKTRLTAAGISISSSGNCSDRNRKNCTSLDQIRTATVDAIIRFKNNSRTTVTITGGTETGHASGTYSHWNGYKLDIAINSGVNNYIQSNFTFIGQMSNGWKQYRDAYGSVWTNEGNHWDIVVK
jgi:hypothetical protein